MKKLTPAVMVLTAALLPVSAMAQKLDVEIINLTHGNYFTPLLVAAHEKGQHLFMPGMAASTNLAAMAEGGDIAGLTADVASMGATYVDNPAGGLLAPGATAMAMLDTKGTKNNQLSVVAMVLPTNDGFVGLNAIDIPHKKGQYTYYLNAYDAGTEANDEIVNGGGAPGVPGIPGAPGGHGGEGATGVTDVETNSMVHVHRGVLGDMDMTGGKSDLDSRVHRWLNPVAKLVLTVK